jgi:hypothetical protein
MNTEDITEAAVLLGLLSVIPVISVFMLGNKFRIPKNTGRKKWVSDIVFWSVFMVLSITLATINAFAFHSSGRQHYAYTSIPAHVFAFLLGLFAKGLAYRLVSENEKPA